MYRSQISTTSFYSNLAAQATATCSNAAMRIRRWTGTSILLHTLTICLSVTVLAALPSTAYSVVIRVDTQEFSAFGAQGVSDSRSSSTFAGASVQLGAGNPNFDFPFVSPFTAPDAEARSFGSEGGTFGGYVNTAGKQGDNFGQRGEAGGLWSETYVRKANITEIPFRISNTRLQ